MSGRAEQRSGRFLAQDISRFVLIKQNICWVRLSKAELFDGYGRRNGGHFGFEVSVESIDVKGVSNVAVVLTDFVFFGAHLCCVASISREGEERRGERTMKTMKDEESTWKGCGEKCQDGMKDQNCGAKVSSAVRYPLLCASGKMVGLCVTGVKGTNHAGHTVKHFLSHNFQEFREKWRQERQPPDKPSTEVPALTDRLPPKSSTLWTLVASLVSLALSLARSCPMSFRQYLDVLKAGPHIRCIASSNCIVSLTLH